MGAHSRTTSKDLSVPTQLVDRRRIAFHPRGLVAPIDDRDEVEADQTAERVVRMPDRVASESGVALRRTPAAGMHLPAGSAGQPLDRATRAFMEPRFGHDFSRVRVHADSAAAESARSLGAYAFTIGDDIVFGAGRYAPATHEGKHLLAHELNHVVHPGPFAIARKADPAAVAKMDARTIMADPDYIENGLVRMEYFAAEQARLYYKDGASLLIGLVAPTRSPPG